jgi:hypothetical protein
VRVEETGILEDPKRPLPLGPLDGHLPGKVDKLDRLDLVSVLGAVLCGQDTTQDQEEPTLPLSVTKPESDAVERGHLINGHVTAGFFQGFPEGSLLDPLAGLNPAGGELKVRRPIALSDHGEATLVVPDEGDHFTVTGGLVGFVPVLHVPIDNASPNSPVALEDTVDLLV